MIALILFQGILQGNSPNKSVRDTHNRDTKPGSLASPLGLYRNAPSSPPSSTKMGSTEINSTVVTSIDSDIATVVTTICPTSVSPQSEIDESIDKADAIQLRLPRRSGSPERLRLRSGSPDRDLFFV